MTEQTRASQTVSVVVPSFRRPESLEVCLAALEAQRDLPMEVIVVVRDDDRDTQALLAERQAGGALNLRQELVSVPGQVGALTAGVSAATSAIVAFTDDDAAPRADWITGLKKWFRVDGVTGAGGRDIIPDHESGPQRVEVGKVKWFGRVVGNHHLGTGRPRDVDVLKGANMAFRREALLDQGFDHRLRGRGAQVHNDLKLCLALRHVGGRLVYDPAVAVDHFPAARPSGDRRSNQGIEEQANAVHNETLALLEYLSPLRRGVFMTWALVIGRRPSPGIGHTAWTAIQERRPPDIDRLKATAIGRWSGWRTYRRGRRDL